MSGAVRPPATAVHNPMHAPGSSTAHWATDNVGEAAPGVLSPLSADVWAVVGDAAPREVAYRIGAFDSRERQPAANPADRVTTMFYGRFAMRVEYMATVGDRLPGTTGRDTVQGLFGHVPETMTFAPTKRRYPVIAYRLPQAFALSPRRIRRVAADTDQWWRTSVEDVDGLDHAAAVALFQDAVERFKLTMTTHTVGLLGTVQPLYDALVKLVDRAGVGDVGALSGTGGAEMAIVDDLWRCSRGEISLKQVVAEHGFHGPLEGELSSRVWREDPSPLESLLSGYRLQPDSANPALRAAQQRSQLASSQREVLAALPTSARVPGRAVLRLSARLLPLRGVGKRAFLQSIDVARASARTVGRHLVERDVLDAPDDVFYLTIDELVAGPEVDAKELVAARKSLRAEYQALELPGTWRGAPTATPLSVGTRGDARILTGTGVSAGVVEGRVRVVNDPSFADVEPEEILVAPTTDPSWASIMFISSALVVDMGGPLSHAAVVARELGIPCVVNTRTGTAVLKTGDLVRIDGSAGTIERLEERAPA